MTGLLFRSFRKRKISSSSFNAQRATLPLLLSDEGNGALPSARVPATAFIANGANVGTPPTDGGGPGGDGNVTNGTASGDTGDAGAAGRIGAAEVGTAGGASGAGAAGGVSGAGAAGVARSVAEIGATGATTGNIAGALLGEEAVGEAAVTAEVGLATKIGPVLTCMGGLACGSAGFLEPDSAAPGLKVPFGPAAVLLPRRESSLKISLGT